MNRMQPKAARAPVSPAFAEAVDRVADTWRRCDAAADLLRRAEAVDRVVAANLRCACAAEELRRAEAALKLLSDRIRGDQHVRT